MVSSGMLQTDVVDEDEIWFSKLGLYLGSVVLN